jgi:hypothetical protein
MTEEKKAEMWLKRHTSYDCAICGVAHEPAQRPKVEYGKLTKAQRLLWDVASTYEYHSRFVVGSEEGEAVKRIKAWLKPGDTVYTVLRRRSSSGTCRHISTLGIEVEGGKPRIVDYTWNVAKIVGWKMDRDTGGIVISGGGMDMGFHLVYTLSRIVFAKFPCIGGACPSNDHVNGDRNHEVGHLHSDGGYALKRQWM